VLVIGTYSWLKSSYNDMVLRREAATAQLGNVENQYQRRMDLIPNLVNTVRGYASHEQNTLSEVVEARAQATQTRIDVNDAAAMARFAQAQGELSSALSRLMAISESYPDLKASQNFRDLQAQLEGTENRITIARQRYIESIKEFNNLVTVPPTSWTNSVMYHFEKMPQWDLAPDEKATAEKAPEVKF
jgi:LemA protein